ncbi:TRAP transporter small permease [Roseibium aggregatum]|uniref:TRAP transporter small permease n=1 Tax=Roseibium aggregatum TaxID=187304 RepID=UPI001AD9182D|nr:TRAP transporter small permease [Roseibium aggregatum]
MQNFAFRAIRASRALNRWVERFCVLLLIVLTLDVWLGILARYFIPFPLTFTEELARYLMIWMALLAISCGISRREHIGVLVLIERLPPVVRKWLAVAIDLTALVFFGVLLVYGVGFVERGFSRLTMIFSIPKGYPFFVVPVAAALACVQLVLVAIHDLFSSDGITAADRAEI